MSKKTDHSYNSFNLPILAMYMVAAGLFANRITPVPFIVFAGVSLLYLIKVRVTKIKHRRELAAYREFLEVLKNSNEPVDPRKWSGYLEVQSVGGLWDSTGVSHSGFAGNGPSRLHSVARREG